MYISVEVNDPVKAKAMAEFIGNGCGVIGTQVVALMDPKKFKRLARLFEGHWKTPGVARRARISNGTHLRVVK